jgi:hypothetical protein
MKYVNNHFVEQVCEQLCEGEIELLRSHVLVTPKGTIFKNLYLNLS